MSRRTAVSFRYAVAIATVSAVSMANGEVSSPTARADSPSGAPSVTLTDSWGAFVADVTIRRSRVSADGKPVGVAAPTVQYHWERTQNGAGWKTVMTLASVTQPTVQSLTGAVPLENPYAVTRIEDDGDGTPLRIYDRQGGLFRMPSEEDMRRAVSASGAPSSNRRLRSSASPAGEWIDQLIATPSRKASRQQALEQNGKAVERIRGLDRFVTTSGDETTEILADPDLALPMEVNLVRNGALVMHTTFAYEQVIGRSPVRRATHTERLLSGDTGERAVTDVEITNVRLEQQSGGAR